MRPRCQLRPVGLGVKVWKPPPGAAQNWPATATPPAQPVRGMPCISCRHSLPIDDHHYACRTELTLPSQCCSVGICCSVALIGRHELPTDDHHYERRKEREREEAEERRGAANAVSHNEFLVRAWCFTLLPCWPSQAIDSNHGGRAPANAVRHNREPGEGRGAHVRCLRRQGCRWAWHQGLPHLVAQHLPALREADGL